MMDLTIMWNLIYRCIHGLIELIEAMKSIYLAVCVMLFDLAS